jgi:deaminated glutathione amidase
MTHHLKVALAQCLGGCDPASIIQEARMNGAEIVVFPEMYSNGYAHLDSKDLVAVENWYSGAESLDGNFIAKFKEAARTHRMHVVATLLEAADPKPFNSAVLIDPNGDVVLHHRKVRICDFDSPENMLGRGNAFEAVEISTSLGPIKTGLMICMDREYSDSARLLSRSGAEILFVPNCCQLASDPIIGDVRIAQTRGRAFETVTGIANYPKPRSDGHSFAVGPTGEVIGIADDSPGVIVVPFDIAAIRKTRIEDQFRWRVS